MKLQPAEKHQYKTIKKLYSRAFPKEECAPFCILKRRALQGRASMLVAQSGGQFIGFAYTVEDEKSVYLFYFAVEENKRGEGNGSKILALLKDYYSGKSIFLAREPLDGNAPNNAQRISRRNFYLKNGFVDLAYKIQEASIIYDLMGSAEDADVDGYNAMMRSWAGAIFSRLVPMRLIKL